MLTRFFLYSNIFKSKYANNAWTILIHNVASYENSLWSVSQQNTPNTCNPWGLRIWFVYLFGRRRQNVEIVECAVIPKTAEILVADHLFIPLLPSKNYHKTNTISPMTENRTTTVCFVDSNKRIHFYMYTFVICVFIRLYTIVVGHRTTYWRLKGNVLNE